jgi:hypothetical protein
MNFLESVGFLAILVVIWLVLLSQNKIRLGARLQGALIIITLYAVYMVGASLWSGISNTLIRPTPTQIQSPTRTPCPVVPTATHEPCFRWDHITPSMKGQEVCVHGIVLDHKENYVNQLTNFYFGTTEQFFLVSNYRWSTSQKGECLTATGIVQLNTYKTPYIKIEDNIYYCEPWME